MVLPFDSLYRHGLFRVACCVPRVALADPKANAEATLALAKQAAARQAGLALFPELGLSGYSNDDLFFQDALLEAVQEAVTTVVAGSQPLGLLLIIGAPLRHQGRLFNCALVIYRGRILGVVPKSYLPNYREFYEKRQFCPAALAPRGDIALAGTVAPFGSDLLFEASNLPELRLFVEICEDLWVPLPPSTTAALAGATLLANLSASNITIGKADYRRRLCAGQSAKCLAAYLYAAAGHGESSTDLAWDGHALVYENGELLAESQRFLGDDQLITADIDLERLSADRSLTTSFNDCALAQGDRLQALRRVHFRFEPPRARVALARKLARFPFVPADQASLDERCREAYQIQVQGLVQRMQASGIHKLVLGLSGGLDSTQALLVGTKALDRLRLPRSHLLAYTLPGFGTSKRTLANARALMKGFGVTAHEHDICPAARAMLQALDHPAGRGQAQYDSTYENVQAGERSAFLFRAANFHRALVLGTSDLSELALGYSTYGVGDHMAHYHLNAAVPKTLIRHLIRWAIKSGGFDKDTARALQAVLDTPCSPELIQGQQQAEKLIGPYELQDFHLFYLCRYGFRPSKVAYLAWQAWGDATRGDWPPDIPEDERHQYDLATIKAWLALLLERFFQHSQFKRSALANAPKVGTLSLSPRGDWRAPSDASAAAWLDELNRNLP
ncbi:NAD(+) synthase [Gallaecimonas sp. GXIMD4217]|uniref:NAD(+) synthase n=1 Tax=Gallaecimonas sp. GXIMD4217 TaxID=3131927 RepID=UPI00311B2967